MITENSANESELAVQFKTLSIEIFKGLPLPDELSTWGCRYWLFE